MGKLTREQVKALEAKIAASGSVGIPGAAEFNAAQAAAHPALPITDPSRVITPIDVAPSTSRGNTVVRGLAKGAGSTADMLEMFGNYAVGPAFNSINRLVGLPEQPIETTSPPWSERAANATGIPAATDRWGKDLESFSTGVGGGAAFAPLAAAGAPAAGVSIPYALGADALAGGLGGLAQSRSEEAGHPFLGALAAMALAPLSTSGPAKLRNVGVDALNEIRVMTPEARALAQTAELSDGAMVRGSSEIKRRVPDVPAFIQEIRDRMRMSNRSGMPHSPSSRQIAEGMEYGRGGRFFTDAERNLTTTDVDYSTDAARRYADSAKELGNRWERLSNVQPDFERFIQNYDEGSSLRDSAERAAWAEAMGGDQPKFNTADMVGRAKQIVGSSYFKRGDVPDAINKLAAGDMTTMDLPRFQELRSVLLGVIRDSHRTGLSKDKHAATMAADMLDMMGKKIDDFAKNDPTGKSEAWSRARQLTLENKTLYDADSPVIRALDKGGQSKNLFETMRRATGRKGNRTNPVEEAQRLVRIAEQTPGGMENLRALAYEDLFSEGFNPNAIRQPEKILRRNEEMYRVIFGKHYDEAVQLLDLTRLHTRGEAGTAAEAYRTGSGVSPAAFLFGIAKSAKNPVQAAVEGAMKLTGKRNARELEWQKIVRTAIEQPEFLRVLLEMPTERALPEWQVAWKQLLAQSSAREAAKAGARAAATETRE